MGGDVCPTLELFVARQRVGQCEYMCVCADGCRASRAENIDSAFSVYIVACCVGLQCELGLRCEDVRNGWGTDRLIKLFFAAHAHTETSVNDLHSQ